MYRIDFNGSYDIEACLLEPKAHSTCTGEKIDSYRTHRPSIQAAKLRCFSPAVDGSFRRSQEIDNFFNKRLRFG